MRVEYLNQFYPESKFGGFSRIDGTVQFYTRVNALIQPDHILLDIGCGRGMFQDDPCMTRKQLRIFKKRCRKVIGIDVDEVGISNPYLDEFRLLTSDTWPIDDDEVDIAICDQVLEHIRDPKFFFTELARTLKPGGFFCCRTPNTYAYPCLTSRLIPNRMHGKILSKVQDDRKSRDVFATYYKCNTARTLSSYLNKAGFEACVYAHEPEPAYLDFSKFVFWMGTVAQRITPNLLKSTLLGFARKRQ